MASSTTVAALLPTTVLLSGDNAINAILSDIPLFCVGIMGIGVFTVLFLTKQVKLLSISLYGSCFLAFAAATLDLSQVLIRRQQTTTTQTISLDSIAGFIYSREVFLSLSIFFLDLFFWYLVAHCPREECIGRTHKLSTSKSRSSPNMHSASWNRWGIIGTVLKYGSLAALISVPLLSLIWRLMPTQRTYSSTYVAESIIQTSIMAVFLLKLLLNVSISPVEPWWRALLSYAVPITSLMIGISLGIGNVVLFSFTETTLGRFLLAVEVYLLIVHNIFNAFHDFQQRYANENSMSSDKTQLEKSQYIASELPFSYPVDGRATSPRAGNNNRTSTFSWILPRRTTVQEDPEVQQIGMVIMPPLIQPAPNGSRLEGSIQNEKDSLEPGVPFRQPQGFGRVAERISQTYDQPSTRVSLSDYSIGPDSFSTREEDMQVSDSNSRLSNEEDRREKTESLRPSSTRAASIGNNQGSISSIDEIIRQQRELDQTIVALRLVSMSIQPDLSNSSKSTVDQYGNTLVRAKTESLSNRSDFSLSVFPDPPIIPNDEVATKYSVQQTGTPGTQRSRTRNVSVDTVKQNIEQSAEDTAPGLSGQLESQVDSAAIYDVTSFIGDLSEPSRVSQTILVSTEDPTSDSEGTPTNSTTQLEPANGLRPMILTSTALTALTNTNTTTPSRQYEDQRVASNSNFEQTLPLRPLLLGNPYINSAPPRMSATKIPLAQRRQRGGTISSNTRRPVISVPLVNQDANEGVSGAYERPRPPPLFL